MKLKHLKYLILAVVLGGVAFMVTYLVGEVKKDLAYTKEMGKPLQDFSFTTLDSTKFTRADMNSSKPSVLVHFNPDCEHCMAEISEIVDTLEAFRRAQIVLISGMPRERVKTFAEESKLDSLEGITVLLDDLMDEGFIGATGFGSTPATVVYNAKGEFVKGWNGEVKAFGILQALEKTRN